MTLRPPSISLWILPLACLVMGCSVESSPMDPLPFGECKCTAEQCPVTVCDIELELDPKTCTGEVNSVEVLVGAQLEQHIWSPGDKKRTCSTIARGATVELYARADTPWQWREDITCPAPDGGVEANGPTIVRVLQCTASAP